MVRKEILEGIRSKKRSREATIRHKAHKVEDKYPLRRNIDFAEIDEEIFKLTGTLPPGSKLEKPGSKKPRRMVLDPGSNSMVPIPDGVVLGAAALAAVGGGGADTTFGEINRI